MGITKKDLFTKEQNEIAELAKAIGHPARIAILEHIIKTNSCINSDLVKELGLAQATISQHLKELKNKHIIIGNIEGTTMCYCINPITWDLLQASFLNLFNGFNGESCCT